MLVNAKFRLPGWCGSTITFQDAVKDQAIRVHWRITALFLRCCGKIVTVHSDQGVVYLNRKSFEAWKESNKVSQFKNDSEAALAINTACSQGRLQTADALFTAGDLNKALDHVKASERLLLKRKINGDVEDPSKKALLDRLCAVKLNISKSDLYAKHDALKKTTRDLFSTNDSMFHQVISRIGEIASEMIITSLLSENSSKWLSERGFKWLKNDELDSLMANVPSSALKVLAVGYDRMKCMDLFDKLAEMLEAEKNKKANELELVAAEAFAKENQATAEKLLQKSRDFNNKVGRQQFQNTDLQYLEKVLSKVSAVDVSKEMQTIQQLADQIDPKIKSWHEQVSPCFSHISMVLIQGDGIFSPATLQAVPNKPSGMIAIVDEMVKQEKLFSGPLKTKAVVLQVRLLCEEMLRIATESAGK